LKSDFWFPWGSGQLGRISEVLLIFHWRFGATAIKLGWALIAMNNPWALEM
jgi:hypothetical protein